MKSSTHARISGISLLLMAVVAIFSFGIVFSNIFVSNDPIATSANLITQSNNFLLGILGWVLVAVLDLIVSIALYKTFKSFEPKLSLSSAVVRIIYTVILGVAIWQQYLAYSVIDTASEQQLYDHLVSFESIWTMGLIIFGVHLGILAVIAFKATVISNVYGWLLAIAGAGYVVVSSAKSLLGNLEWVNTLEMVLSAPMAIGELALAIWLIVKAKKFD